MSLRPSEIYGAASTERDADGAKSPPPKGSTPVCTKFAEDEKLPLTGFLAISDETHEEHVGSPYIVFLDEPLCWNKDPDVVINSVAVTNGARLLLGRHVSFVGKMIAGDSWGAENSPMVLKSER